MSDAWRRVFFQYGPGERPERLVPTVIRALLQQQPAYCTSSKQIRDYLHVQDVADALVKLLDSSVRGRSILRRASLCPSSRLFR